MIKNGVRRFYTPKSYKLMETVRKIILIITSPLWFVLYILYLIGDWSDRLLDFLDTKLQDILDKVIPQIK